MGFKKYNAIWIASMYIVLGVIWILTTDWILFRAFPNFDDFAYFSTVKGIVFVVLSGIVIWTVVTVKNHQNNNLKLRLIEQSEKAQSIQKTLKDQKDLLIASIEHAPIPMMLHKENKQIIAISRTFFERTGYHLQDIPTIRAWVENANPYNHEEYYDHMMDLYTISKTVYEGEYQVQTKDGDILNWSFSSYYLGRDEQGLKIIITTAIDITEQKTKEKELTHKSYHDDLTSLYNRRYYNEMTKRFEQMRDIGLILADVNGLKMINDVFGHADGDQLLIDFAKTLKKHFPKDSIIARLGGDEFIVILPDFDTHDLNKIKENVKKDISKQHKNIPPSVAMGYSMKRAKEDLKATFKRAEDRLYKDKIEEYDRQTDTIIDALKTTLFEKTDESKKHIESLHALAKPLYDKLHFSKERIDELETLIELHDIGKIAINEKIYSVKGPLDEDLRKEMERHCEIGYRIANALPRLKSVSYAILTHHENIDGSGYPFGLKGDEIPISARLFRILESYEALRRDKIYKKRVSKEKALKEIKSLKGSHFDQELVDYFIKTQTKA